MRVKRGAHSQSKAYMDSPSNVLAQLMGKPKPLKVQFRDVTGTKYDNNKADMCSYCRHFAERPENGKPKRFCALNPPWIVIPEIHWCSQFDNYVGQLLESQSSKMLTDTLSGDIQSLKAKIKTQAKVIRELKKKKQ